MAVYTVLNREEVAAFIGPVGIGPLVSFEGVFAGIDNSNYFITTDQSDFRREERTAPLQHFVLTIFESIPAEKLSSYIDLTTLLNHRGLPVPCPITDSHGTAMHPLHGKPALLTPKIAGEAPLQPSPVQCRAIGKALAGIHRVTQDSNLQLRSRDLDWLAQQAGTLAARLPVDEQPLLAEVSRFQQLASQHPGLPQAIIHGDLFRDNTLFEGDNLNGIIDFNTAHYGYLLLDLAIVANDWCSDDEGRLLPALAEPLIDSYQRERPLQQAEKALWNDFLRLGAARFWVSRLAARHEASKPGELVETKDPDQYRAILKRRICEPETID